MIPRTLPFRGSMRESVFPARYLRGGLTLSLERPLSTFHSPASSWDGDGDGDGTSQKHVRSTYRTSSVSELNMMVCLNRLTRPIRIKPQDSQGWFLNHDQSCLIFNMLDRESMTFGLVTRRLSAEGLLDRERLAITPPNLIIFSSNHRPPPPSEAEVYSFRRRTKEGARSTLLLIPLLLLLLLRPLPRLTAHCSLLTERTIIRQSGGIDAYSVCRSHVMLVVRLAHTSIRCAQDLHPPTPMPIIIHVYPTNRQP